MKLLTLAPIAAACLLASCLPTTPKLGSKKADISPQSKANAKRLSLQLDAKENGISSLSELISSLEDENPFVRRTALRLIAEQENETTPLLKKALSNSDHMVRRNAIIYLGRRLSPDDMLPLMERAIVDTDPDVRLAAAQELVKVSPPKGLRLELLRMASNDKDKAVHELATRSTWSFHKNKVLLRNRQDWDHDVKVIQEIPLPKEDWAFTEDPRNDGHNLNWFGVNFDDSSWKRIPIETSWENTVGAYDGIAWYRKKFKLPAKPAKFNAIEISFGAVDEEAWVWINGKYVGQHDDGPNGWDKPFNIDITDEIKWGEENVITVRVNDSAFAGGIWKPVTIQVME